MKWDKSSIAFCTKLSLHLVPGTTWRIQTHLPSLLYPRKYARTKFWLFFYSIWINVSEIPECHVIPIKIEELSLLLLNQILSYQRRHERDVEYPEKPTYQMLFQLFVSVLFHIFSSWICHLEWTFCVFENKFEYKNWFYIAIVKVCFFLSFFSFFYFLSQIEKCDIF